MLVDDGLACDHRVHSLGLHVSRIQCGEDERVTALVLSAFGVSRRSVRGVRGKGLLAGQNYMRIVDENYSLSRFMEARRCYLLSLLLWVPSSIRVHVIHRLGLPVAPVMRGLFCRRTSFVRP